MKAEELKAYFREYSPLLLIILLGIVLLLLPSGSGNRRTEKADYSAKEEKLSEVLSAIDGVGSCKVLLRESEKNEKGGAIVVCEGADEPGVCLKIKNAVAAYTGLGSNRIVILKSSKGGKGK